MKASKVSAVLTLIFSLFLCGDLLGFTPLVDEFKEPELNAKRWKLVQSGNARLFYYHGTLHFTVGTKASKQEDFAYVELRHNQPGYNEIWMVRLSVYNSAPHGRKTGLGFWIYNADDPTDAMIFQLNCSPDGPRGLKTARVSFFVNDARIETELKRQVRTDWSIVDLIITFNPKVKLFTFWCGEPHILDTWDRWDWFKVGTFSPAGDRGDARADWKMNAGSGRFGIRLAGFGSDLAVEDGRAGFDYFALKPKIELPD